ncbi:hypothetical protein [Rathayibacter rathayi]|uniref:hypothetical protein n=1 Tax=Rathayibacter rathayi TaxID=33887 RepID=UPI003B96F04A
MFTAQERERSFLEGMWLPGPLCHDAHDERAAEEIAVDLLGLGTPPTAVMGGQNLIPIGVLAALHRLGGQGGSP